MQIRNLNKWILVGCLYALLVGCQQPGVDPYICINRPIYHFNKAVDRVALKPAARIYEALLPKPVQKLVSNFYQNLSEVPSAANHLIQANFPALRLTLARLMVNTTWGMGGLLDVAGSRGMAIQKQDFGLTLAKFGYKESAYVVLPIFGPSTVRDGFGRLGTYYMGVPAHMKSVKWRNRIVALGFLDARVALLKAEPALAEAVDEYVFVRNAYLQRRNSEIAGKQDSSEELEGPPE